jgi:hypothetical protein
MPPTEAVERLNAVLAHLWMIRTFLKHADEVTEDDQLIEVPRLLYDSIRAVEPAFLAGDHATYIRRMRGKLPKLKKCAEMFAAEYKRVSAHTNFEMASASLTGAVRQMDEILSAVASGPEPAPAENSEQ